MQCAPDDICRSEFQIDRLPDQVPGIGKASNRSIESRKSRSRRVIIYRATVGAAIEGRQRIFAGCSERGILLGEKLTTEIAEGNEIGGIGSRNRRQLTPALGQIDRKGIGEIG